MTANADGDRSGGGGDGGRGGGADPSPAADDDRTRTSEPGAASLRDRLGYLVKLSRPRFWFYLAGPVVVGVAFAAETTAELFAPVAVLLFAYFLLPANVLLYGVNDVFDADVDEENPKKEDREVRFGGQTYVVGAVAAAGLLGLLLFPATAMLGGEAAWPWLVGFFVLAAEYSAPPFRFKTTPFLDSLSNGLYVLPGAAAFAALAGGNPPALAVLGGWLWAMGMHTFSAVPDIDPDRAAGIRTTATALGERRSYAYCGACWLAAAGLFGLLDVRLGLLLLAYPVVVAAIAVSDVDVDRAYWWYPALNTAVGAVMTLGALRRLVYG